jgi:hypothetical protein
MRHILLVSVLLVFSPLLSEAGTATIFKVLPHHIDQKGQHVLAPSLFERDAYQAYLRENAEERSGMRFDINWRAKGFAGSSLVMRVEMRGSEQTLGTPVVIERSVRPARMFRSWSSLHFDGEEYGKFGNLLAWRVTLWRGEEMLAERKSFLW